ncbi:MAG: hypothetical protein H0Z39_07645 [Peptococcaceae bacterium]|nr:hypothetical protein [Peptococcaceae bacterium]
MTGEGFPLYTEPEFEDPSQPVVGRSSVSPFRASALEDEEVGAGVPLYSLEDETYNQPLDEWINKKSGHFHLRAE